MPFTDVRPSRRALSASALAFAASAALVALAATGGLAGCASPSAPEAAPAATPARAPAGPVVSRAPATSERPAASMEEVRRRAALRIVQMNPSVTYTSPAPRDLLAVQVLEIQLNADGSVRRIDVIRKSEFGAGTVEIAKAAIERAAPFSDVRHLRKPWSFTETFLFTDDRRFKPRILDN